MRIVLIAVTAIALLLPGVAFAEETISVPAVEYDLSQWQQIWQELPGEVRGLFGGMTPRELIESYRLGAQDILDGQALKYAVKNSFIQAMSGMGSIMAVLLMMSLADIMVGGKEGVGEMLVFCMGGLCVSLITVAVYDQFNQAIKAVESMARVTEATSPVLMTLIAACGSARTAASQPAAILMCNAVTNGFKTVLMPLIPVMCGFTAAGCITGHSQLKAMAGLIKSLLKWGMGLAFTVFLGSISIRSINAMGLDRAGIKAIKYAFDKSVPVVGGMISGTYDSLLAGAVVLKNAAGTAAVLLLILTVLSPVLSMLSTIITLRLTGTACALFSDSRISGMLEGAAESCTYMFAVCATVALMNLITISASLTASGV